MRFQWLQFLIGFNKIDFSILPRMLRSSVKKTPTSCRHLSFETLENRELLSAHGETYHESSVSAGSGTFYQYSEDTFDENKYTVDISESYNGHSTERREARSDVNNGAFVLVSGSGSASSVGLYESDSYVHSELDYYLAWDSSSKWGNITSHGGGSSRQTRDSVTDSRQTSSYNISAGFVVWADGGYSVWLNNHQTDKSITDTGNSYYTEHTLNLVFWGYSGVLRAASMVCALQINTAETDIRNSLLYQNRKFKCVRYITMPSKQTFDWQIIPEFRAVCSFRPSSW